MDELFIDVLGSITLTNYSQTKQVLLQIVFEKNSDQQRLLVKEIYNVFQKTLSVAGKDSQLRLCTLKLLRDFQNEQPKLFTNALLTSKLPDQIKNIALTNCDKSLDMRSKDPKERELFVTAGQCCFSWAAKYPLDKNQNKTKFSIIADQLKARGLKAKQSKQVKSHIQPKPVSQPQKKTLSQIPKQTASKPQPAMSAISSQQIRNQAVKTVSRVTDVAKKVLNQLYEMQQDQKIQTQLQKQYKQLTALNKEIEILRSRILKQEDSLPEQLKNLLLETDSFALTFIKKFQELVKKRITEQDCGNAIVNKAQDFIKLASSNKFINAQSGKSASKNEQSKGQSFRKEEKKSVQKNSPNEFDSPQEFNFFGKTPFESKQFGQFSSFPDPFAKVQKEKDGFDYKPSGFGAFQEQKVANFGLKKSEIKLPQQSKILGTISSFAYEGLKTQINSQIKTSTRPYKRAADIGFQQNFMQSVSKYSMHDFSKSAVITKNKYSGRTIPFDQQFFSEFYQKQAVLIKNGQSIRKLKSSFLKDKGVLLENEQLQIGHKSQTGFCNQLQRQFLKIQLFIGNKTNSEAKAFQIKFIKDWPTQVYTHPKKIQQILPGHQAKFSLIIFSDSYELINLLISYEISGIKLQTELFVPSLVIKSLKFQKPTVGNFRQEWRRHKKNMIRSKIFNMSKLISSLSALKKYTQSFSEITSLEAFMKNSQEYKICTVLKQGQEKYMVKVRIRANHTAVLQMVTAFNQKKCQLIIQNLQFILSQDD